MAGHRCVRQLVALCSLALAATSSGAQTLTVDFNEWSTAEQALTDQITSDGFVFSNHEAGWDGLGIWPRDQGAQADPQQAAVFVNRAYTTTTASQQSGQPFDFYSIDLTDIYNRGEPLTVEFTFQYARGGTDVETVSLPRHVGLQTIELHKVGLSSVSWRTVGGPNGWSQFDNFRASPDSSVMP